MERVAGLFTGPDLPDEPLVRACLDSYRSLASTPERLVTADDVARRSVEHGELIARLVDLGHRLGFACWIGLRQQSRRTEGAPLGGPARRPGADRPSVPGTDPRRGPRGRRRRSGTSVAARRSCGRSNGRRCWASPSSGAMPGSRPTTGSSASWSCCPNGPSWSATSWSARRCCATALDERRLAHPQGEPPGRVVPHEGPALDDLEPLLGLDPAIERTGDQLALFGG